MRLELVCALLVIAVVTIGTSAEESGRNYVDDDAFDGDDVQSVLGDDDGRSVLGDDDGRSVLGDDDGRSVRDARHSCRACHHCRRHHGHRHCKHLCRHC